MTKAYLASSGDRQTLVQQLALTACRLGNDPHKLGDRSVPT
jgi:hypothetical protein